VWLYRTRAGVTMRAGVDDRPLATLNGARPDRSAMLAWAIGCSLAALAGILMAPDLGLQHLLLTLLIVNAYAAAMIGRLRSLSFTFLGAVILGLADAYGAGYLPSGNDYLKGFQGTRRHGRASSIRCRRTAARSPPPVFSCSVSRSSPRL